MTARARWLIGGGVAAGAVLAAAAAALLLSARAVPDALTYVPGNAVVVAELRLDLPGDQLQRVGNLLAHFPGFADQSTLGAKLDETFDRLARAASNGSVDYTTKLKPWLAGPTFVGVLPAAGGQTASPAPTTPPGGLPLAAGADGVIVATTDGKVTCDAAIQGGTARPIEQGSMLVDATGTSACFMDGRFGLLGTPTGIEAALAAHAGGTGIERDATYALARNTLSGDQLATAYLTGAATALMTSTSVSLPSAFPVSLPIGFPAAGSLPAWLIAGLRAEDDALVTDLFVAPSSPGAGASTAAGSTLPTLPPPHASDIAGFLPNNTMLLAELHGAGASAQSALAALRSDPTFQSEAAQLDAGLALAGGPEGVVGWISDAAAVAIPSSTGGSTGATPGVDAGLVLVATDEATATTKVAQLKSLLGLLALSGGGSVSDAPFEGATITTIDLGDLTSLLNQAGGGSLNGLPIPTGLRATFTLTVRGRLVLIGGDEGFPRDVIGVDAGQSLADAPAYKRSIGHGLASNLGQVYVAGANVWQLLPGLLPTDVQARWQTDDLPFVQPIDGVLLTSTVEHGLSHTRLVLTVSTPPPTPASSASPAPAAS